MLYVDCSSLIGLLIKALKPDALERIFDYIKDTKSIQPTRPYVSEFLSYYNSIHSKDDWLIMRTPKRGDVIIYQRKKTGHAMIVTKVIYAKAFSLKFEVIHATNTYDQSLQSNGVQKTKILWDMNKNIIFREDKKRTEQVYQYKIARLNL